MSGFQSFTADGALQFDANLTSYGYRQKGSATAQKVIYSNAPYMEVAVTVAAATYPLVFIRGERPVHLLYVTQSGGNWTFRYLTTDSFSDNTSSFSFDYYVFDRMATGGTYGLELYNAAGQLTFTSNQPPLRLLYVGTAPSGGGTISIPAMTGRVCAAALSVGRVEQVSYNGSGHYGYMESIKVLSNGVSISWPEEWYVVDDFADVSESGQGGASMILVADVTGY